MLKKREERLKARDADRKEARKRDSKQAVCVCVCVLEVCQGACQPARLSWRAPAGGGGFRRAPCLHWPTGACWERVREGGGGEGEGEGRYGDREGDRERERPQESKRKRRGDRRKEVETGRQTAMGE